MDDRGLFGIAVTDEQRPVVSGPANRLLRIIFHQWANGTACRSEAGHRRCPTGGDCLPISATRPTTRAKAARGWVRGGPHAQRVSRADPQNRDLRPQWIKFSSVYNSGYDMGHFCARTRAQKNYLPPAFALVCPAAALETTARRGFARVGGRHGARRTAHGARRGGVARASWVIPGGRHPVSRRPARCPTPGAALPVGPPLLHVPRAKDQTLPALEPRRRQPFAPPTLINRGGQEKLAQKTCTC